MNKYEALYILNADLDEEAVAATSEKFAQIVKDNAGEVVEVKPWGKRRLAYPINFKNEGYYVLMTFKAEVALLADLEHNFKVTEDVVRYIIVRQENED